jgi:hypothetical protein
LTFDEAIESSISATDLINHFEVDGNPGIISSVNIISSKKIEVQFNTNISGNPDLIYTPVDESPLRDNQGNTVKEFKRIIK